jgi:hypothetical protein
MARLRHIFHVGERSLERVHLVAWLWSLRYEAMIAVGMIVTAAYTLWDHIKQTNPLLILRKARGRRVNLTLYIGRSADYSVI